MLGLRVIVTIAALWTLGGCVYAYQTMRAAPGERVAGRPDPSYYCYDCHGYRFFDPYYDWCPNYGFRYRWDRPRVVQLYRERYVALKERDPSIGRFTYPKGYRLKRRYLDPREYGEWQNLRERRTEDRGGDGERRDATRGRKKRSSEKDRIPDGRPRHLGPQGAWK